DATRDSAGVRWLMSSDVCKHCTSAACLDVCPTGALIRTECGTVVGQQDVCIGSGYCVAACPLGVIDEREADGRSWKCRLSYYGRPILKRPVWKWWIPAYFFSGGLAAGSSALALGAQLSGRSMLRRRARVVSLVGITFGAVCLVADLGRPSRFHHMLRVAKP